MRIFNLRQTLGIVILFGHNACYLFITVSVVSETSARGYDKGDLSFLLDNCIYLYILHSYSYIHVCADLHEFSFKIRPKNFSTLHVYNWIRIL